MPSLDLEDKRPDVNTLLKNLKENLPELRQLLAESSNHWEYEDPIYRFYHGSFKVFNLQTMTLQIVGKLQSLLPTCPLNASFQAILSQGTGKEFSLKDNARWLENTRPIVEAFFHARFFLEMAVKYGEKLESPPTLLESGWAAFLYLYNLR